MSHLGVLATPSVVTENVTNQIFHGFGSAGGVISGNGEGFRPSVGKHCIDLHQRLIPHGVHFVPGPDECTLCACDDGEPKWCKAVLCSPPQDCKSFRVGNSCCDFICLDDSLNNNGGPNTGGPYLSRPVEIANFVPKVVIAAVTAMLSLSLLFFLIHRLRQRHIQAGRLNSARARRSTQMCDECDDTRSLDFSNDFFEHRMNSPHLYPPQYLAWWKPPSSYFPPRGEAPPPYEEAMMATTSIGGGGAITTNLPVPSYNNNNLQNQNNNNNLRGSSENGLLSDMPIIVPPPVLPPGPVASQSHRSPAIQRLASAIASSAGAFPKLIGSGGACATTVITSSSSSSSSAAVVAANNIPKHAKDHLQQQQPSVHLHNHHHQEGESEGARLSPSSSALSSKRSSPKLKSESSKVNKHKSSKNQNHQEPQPGPSGNSGGSDHPDASSSSPRAFKIKPPQHGPAPPPYEDAIYSLHPSNSVAPPPPPSSGAAHHGRDFYRHSLTLPPRRYLDSPSQPQHHLVVAAGYPSVVIRTGGSSQGHLSLFPSENHSHRNNNSSGQHQHHHHNQRYSLQFPVSVGEMGGDDDGRGGDWSSSSSTLSLSTTPNSPVGRAPSELSSSSESSVSESHSHPPPPPPAPSSGPSSSSNNSSRA